MGVGVPTLSMHGPLTRLFGLAHLHIVSIFLLVIDQLTPPPINQPTKRHSFPVDGLSTNHRFNHYAVECSINYTHQTQSNAQSQAFYTWREHTGRNASELNLADEDPSVGLRELHCVRGAHQPQPTKDDGARSAQ